MFLRKILALVLVVSILVSTTGFTVYEHKCLHTGKTTVSLIKGHSACCMCAEMDQKASCCHDAGKCPHRKSNHCCEEVVKIYKLDVPIDHALQKTIQFLNVEACLSNFVIEDYTCDTEVNMFIGFDNYIETENSPPLFILFHQLKIMSSHWQSV